jgi:hypothetical protein
MKHELLKQIAKIGAMRKQCLETRGRINDAKVAMHDDVQADVDTYGAMARLSKPGADIAYANFLKNRALLNR